MPCGWEDIRTSGVALAMHHRLQWFIRPMPNSHRPPDTTRQCCLYRVRRCELSLETVWQSEQLADSSPSSRGV